MRIFVGGILTETNTFSPVPTGLNDYRMGYGDDHESNAECQILTHLKQRIETRGWQCLPSFLAVAEPAGITTRKAYETLREKLFDDLKQAIPVDMILLPLHGAMVAEGYDDCEGDITQRVRDIVGADVAIGVLLDLHCHLSDTLLNSADLIAIYREYPHTDILQRAEALLDMTADKVMGKTAPVMATFDCRIINLYPTSIEPMRSLVESFIRTGSTPRHYFCRYCSRFPMGRRS